MKGDEFDIVTFGSAVIDTFIDTEFNKKKDSFIYQAGSKILVNSMKHDIGGGATNTGVAFSRLGFKVGCICKLGDDQFGNAIIDMLEKEKITFLGSRTKGATGNSIILDSTGADRTILTFKGPGNSIKKSELSKFKTKWLYYSSVLGESLKTQISLAKNSKAKLAFNPSEYLVKKVNIKPLLKITEVLILNKEEAELLCKKNNLHGKTIEVLTKLGPKIVVITDKNNPVQAFDGKKTYSIKPHKIKVVERTGAGDAFASGFVSGLLAGKTIPECLKLGLAEGESVLKYFGAKNNLLRMKIK